MTRDGAALTCSQVLLIALCALMRAMIYNADVAPRAYVFMLTALLRAR